MSKRNAIIITLLATIIAVAGLIAWYLFLSPQAGNQTEGGTGGIRDIISSFFPEGAGPEDTGEPPSTTNGQTGGSNQETPLPGGENQPTPLIREISQDPVSGFTLVEDKKEGTVARYLESGTGHTWSAPLSVVTKTRLTNTTIPKVREALWLSSGGKVIVRYLDDQSGTIKSFAGEVKPKTSDVGTILEGDLTGEFLRDDITDLVVNPISEKIFYLVTESGEASGVIADPDGGKATRVFSSPIREWLPQWVTGNILYLTTKASAQAPGLLYSLNTSTGAQTKILGNTYGLTTNVSPKNTRLLYSDSRTNGFRLFVYDLGTKNASELSLSTLAEKCAWDPSDGDVIYCGIPDSVERAGYPDAWYKGLVSFEDNLWRLNVKTGEVRIVAQFDTVTSKRIDVFNPAVSKNGDYVVFTNKQNNSLWSVKVK